MIKLNTWDGLTAYWFPGDEDYGAGIIVCASAKEPDVEDLQTDPVTFLCLWGSRGMYQLVWGRDWQTEGELHARIVKWAPMYEEWGCNN